MDLTQSERSRALADRLKAFMREFVYPAEEVYTRQRREGDPHRLPPVVANLQREARARGLWNLFMRHPEWGPGLSERLINRGAGCLGGSFWRWRRGVLLKWQTRAP